MARSDTWTEFGHFYINLAASSADCGSIPVHNPIEICMREAAAGSHERVVMVRNSGNVSARGKIRRPGGLVDYKFTNFATYQ